MRKPEKVDDETPHRLPVFLKKVTYTTVYKVFWLPASRSPWKLPINYRVQYGYFRKLAFPLTFTFLT